MTNDFKTQLLNYITGNISTNGNVDEVILNQQNSITDNYDSFCEENFGYYNNFYILGTLDFKNTDNIFVYGNYKQNGVYYGAIVIFDNKFNPIKAIKTFDTGTRFFKFELLKVDENNTVYGVDNNYTSDANIYRFILLNDIVSSGIENNDYRVILRTSYYFPSSYNTIKFANPEQETNSTNRIYKEYNGSSYLFIGQASSTNYLNIITLKVNVGEANEWNLYSYSSAVDQVIGIGSYAVWQNDSLNLKIGYSANDYYYVEVSFNGTTITENLRIQLSNIEKIAILPNINTYVVQKTSTSSTTTINYLRLNYEMSHFDNIDSYVFNDVAMTYKVFIQTINNLLFICFYANETEFKYVYTSILLNDDVKTDIQTTSNYNVQFFIANNNFNLYTTYALTRPQISTGTNYIFSYAVDYNSTNYNGIEYVDYNSLIPNKSVLFNENDIIFSRNLYNKTILNNSTTSTVEIPNALLNDIPITNNNLVGKTNLNLVINNNNTTKNIYETLFMNYINTINVINEDTNTSYQNTATYINNNINIGTESNYNNTFMSKVRINKTTPVISTAYWNKIDNTHYNIELTLYVDENIPSIDFISNDETTNYISIDTSSMETGKYYTISQKLRIE